MAKNRQCPQCNEELPADAPMGLCPQCVLNMAATQQVTQPASAPPQPKAPGQAQPPFVPPAPAELAESFPQLEVLELLGRGGMGAVYKARQPTLDRLVALKILPPSLGGDATFAERFTREARSLARLNHPNIVGIYDFGQAAGLYYFVMEYVDGVNLRQMEGRQPMAPQEALAIVPQICDALQYAHDEGIVHRDIKPENILIDKKGRVKIADFGLAKLLARTPADYTLTKPRQVMGTVHYMAPEQIECSSAVDQRADIFSLGVVFYEMLTGELPLGRFDPPSQKVQIDVRLDEVVLKTLEKEPDRRYQHVSQVGTDVEQINRQAEIPPPPPLAEPAPPPAPPQASIDDSTPPPRVGGPATGLLITGILYCLSVASLMLVMGWLHYRMGPEPTGVAHSNAPSTGDGPANAEHTRGDHSNAPSAGVGPANVLLLTPAMIWLVLALAAGVLIIVGSIKMMRGRSSAWGRTAAVLAVIPLPMPLIWPLGLAMGIWALVALSRPDVKAAFAAAAQRRDAVPVSPADRVRPPAIGLMVGGIFLFAGSCILALWSAWRIWDVPGGLETERELARMGLPDLFRTLGLLALAFASGLLFIVAAVKMMRLRSSTLAWISAILVMILLGLPGLLIGIWVLLALSRPDVKAAFAATARGREANPVGADHRVKWPAFGMIAAAGINAARSYLAMKGSIAAEPVAIIVMMLLIIVAAWRMIDLRSYRLAVVGSVLLMIPVGIENPLGLIGVPFGIWALIVLRRRDVQAAFAAAQRPDKGRRRKTAWIVAALLIGALVLLAVPIGIVVVRHLLPRWSERQSVLEVPPSEGPGGVTALFGGNDWEGLITKTGVEIDRGISSTDSGTSLKVVADSPTVVRLFKHGSTTNMYEAGPYGVVDNSRLTYRANLRSWGLQGQAYLEMRCHFPSGKEFASRGLDTAVSGTKDWTSVETSFVVKGEKEPDNVQLNLVIDGKGTVWIDRVTLTLDPPANAQDVPRSPEPPAVLRGDSDPKGLLHEPPRTTAPVESPRRP